MTETQERRIPAFTFEDAIETVAHRLVGANITTSTNRFIVNKVRYFLPEDVTRNSFQDAKNSLPGTITGSPYRNTVLANVSVKNGGLIMITDVMDVGEDRDIEGPGKVAKAMGVEKGEKYVLKIIDPFLPSFYLTTTTPEE